MSFRVMFTDAATQVGYTEWDRGMDYDPDSYHDASARQLEFCPYSLAGHDPAFVTNGSGVYYHAQLEEILPERIDAALMSDFTASVSRFFLHLEPCDVPVEAGILRTLPFVDFIYFPYFLNAQSGLYSPDAVHRLREDFWTVNEAGENEEFFNYLDQVHGQSYGKDLKYLYFTLETNIMVASDNAGLMLFVSF